MQLPSEQAEISDECNRALELYSALRDGELDAAEQGEWVRLSEKYAAEISEFAASWGSVVSLLQGLSGSPVGDRVMVQVAAGLDSKQPVRKELPRRGWAHQLTAAASLLALSLMVVVLAVSGLQPSMVDQANRGWDATDRWRVVVVAAKESDREAVLGRLQGFVGKSEPGLTVNGVTGAELIGNPADRIVLEGDFATSSQFVSQLEEAQLVEPPSWDPVNIGEMSRQELIAAVRRSQQAPTLSEHHFGLIIVDFPEPGETLVADSRNDVEKASKESTAPGRVEAPVESALNHRHQQAQLCLVILEFSKPNADSATDPTRNLL